MPRDSPSHRLAVPARRSNLKLCDDVPIIGEYYPLKVPVPVRPGFEPD